MPVFGVQGRTHVWGEAGTHFWGTAWHTFLGDPRLALSLVADGAGTPLRACRATRVPLSPWGHGDKGGDLAQGRGRFPAGRELPGRTDATSPSPGSR